MKKLIQLFGMVILGLLFSNSALATPCKDATDPGTISISESPTCQGKSVTASIISGPGSEWSVSNVTGSITPTGAGTSKTVTFTGSGTATITVKNTDWVDGTGTCTKEKSSSINVTVNASPDNPTITGPSTACQGEQLTFTTSTTGGTSPYTFTWGAASGTGWTGGGGTGASKGYTAGSSNGTVSVTVKDSKNCTAANGTNKTVTVTPTPTPPTLQSITNP